MVDNRTPLNYSSKTRRSTVSSRESRVSGQWQTRNEPIQPPTNASMQSRARWLRAGRHACLAARVVNALKPDESKYFRQGRIIASLWADHVLIWPFRDVRFLAIDQSFTSYSKMIDFKRVFLLSPLHLAEDIFENYLETRDLIESRSAIVTPRHFREILLLALAWPLYNIHQRILASQPIGLPHTWTYGIFSHMAVVAPFIGGIGGGAFTKTFQTGWLLTCCKPLDVLALYCAKWKCNEIEGARQIMEKSGYAGFFAGTTADLRLLLGVMLAHTLSSQNVQRKYLGMAMAVNCVGLKWGNQMIKEVALVISMAIGTSVLKKAVSEYFGIAPVRIQREEVRFTEEFLQGKEVASALMLKLASRAEAIPFQTQVDLNRSWDKRMSLEVPLRPSISQISKRVSQMLTRRSSSTALADPSPPQVYLSGFMDDLLGVNGQFDLYEAIHINSRPVYRKDVGDDSFLYLLYDDWQKWVLTNSLMPDPPFIVAYCQDLSVLPHNCTGIWQVAEKNGFVKDASVKVSKEPTLFLRRMSVFSTLNAMIEEGEISASGDIDRAVEPADTFVLLVRRENLVKSSLMAVLGAHPAELVAREFSIRFQGEDGLDYGGVRREWFSLLGTELLKTTDLDLVLWNKRIKCDGSLFEPTPDRSLMLRPVPVDFYVAIGRLLAMALIHEAAFPLNLCFVVYKYILQMPINATDLRALDPQFYQFRLAALLAPGGADNISEMLGESLTFVSAASPWGTGGLPLCENGETRQVEESNKMEYAQLLSENYLCGNMRHQLQALVTGFWDLCPLKALRSMDAKDLQALIMGPTELLNVDALRRNAKFQPEKGKLPQFDWFFEAAAQLSADESVRLVQFFSGSARVPEEGLRPPFTLVVNSAWDMEQLPIAHTCANMICIPAYPDYAVLFDKLQQAVANNVGFGFA
eukprot:GEMP01005121.1.p1 GENE.GEMP01005121.1~~GEMP01005121.1.p1  ORF type:complete len:937 (+),score=115.33 GEMP01005121.1:49-2811(+)